jgi:hypothetical protein
MKQKGWSCVCIDQLPTNMRGFPFDRYKIGALDVEHNYEEPKRSQIFALMKSHGYKRVNSWEQDDSYVANENPLPAR